MKQLLFYSLLFLGITSCQEFLTREPGMQTSFDEQLATEDGVLAALNGSYGELNKVLANTKYLYADLMGGNLTFTPTLTGSNAGTVSVPPNYRDIYSFDDEESETTFKSIYTDLYELIASANLVLERIDAVPMEAALRDRVVAELYALRGLCHFELVRLYGQAYDFTPGATHLGIVNVDRVLEIGIDFPARQTVAENYALIVDDLQRALEIGDGEPALSIYPRTNYFNKPAIEGLLARVYLYQQNWSAAAERATNVIEQPGIALTPKQEYIEQWIEPDLPVSETLMEMAASRSDAEGTVGFTLSSFFRLPFQNSVGDYSASLDLIELFSDTDIRKTGLILPVELPTTVDEASVQLPYFFTLKFQDNPGVPVIRLSELYLIRAEANAQLGNLNEARADLDIIRQRADAEADPLGELSQQELLDAIFLERRKELAFEGHLFFDIKRTGRDVIRDDGCIARTCNLAYPNPRFVLPIPLSTLQVNENMVQNEGY